MLHLSEPVSLRYTPDDLGTADTVKDRQHRLRSTQQTHSIMFATECTDAVLPCQVAVLLLACLCLDILISEPCTQQLGDI
jgi:hypothetical protein